jgi:hypothetical protein
VSPLKDRRDIRDRAAGVEQFGEFHVIFIAPRLAGIGRQCPGSLAIPHLVTDRGQSNVKRANDICRLYRRARVQHLTRSGIDTICESFDEGA